MKDKAFNSKFSRDNCKMFEANSTHGINYWFEKKKTYANLSKVTKHFLESPE